MITPEEWENLKIGNEIYLIMQLSVFVHTYTIINIREGKKKTLQIQGSPLFLDYSCFTGDYFYINKKEALNQLITKLNINIYELKIGLREAKKQLEQENGKTRSYRIHI